MCRGRWSGEACVLEDTFGTIYSFTDFHYAGTKDAAVGFLRSWKRLRGWRFISLVE